MVADPTTQQPDLASLLGQSQTKASLGDIVGLLQEMRARRESASKQSASPLAELLGGLVGQGGVSAGGDYKSALGGIIAAMEQDKLRRNMIGDLQSGKLAPLNQLQQQNGPQDAGFLGDLQQLGIAPEDFRAILGLKPNTPVAPTQAAPSGPPMADPNDPITQAIQNQNNKTGQASAPTPAILSGMGAKMLPPTRSAAPPIDSGVSDILAQILQRRNLAPSTSQYLGAR